MTFKKSRPRCRTCWPQLEALEDRRLLAVTPASVLTVADRQTLADNLRSSSIRNTLQAELASKDVAGFDSALLEYMRTRTNAKFFFDDSHASSIGSYIASNIGDSGAIRRANNLVKHILPAHDNETAFTYNAGPNIDWLSGSGNPETLHTINRHAFWMDLSEGYRFTGNVTYVNELISELATWSATYPTMDLPSRWSKTDQRSWLLDMSVRVDQWNWSYFQLLESSAWTKEANSLFLYKMQQQIAHLGSAWPYYPIADNRSLFHASTWLTSADMFPEFKASDATTARTAVFEAFDAQYYPDGSHREQSPGYANNGIENLLELKLLDSINGYNWPNDRVTKLKNAMNAYYQFLTPDGARPALGDTYRSTSATTFLKASVILGVDAWAPAKPRGRDVWLLGTGVAAANADKPSFPMLSDRGESYAMPDSGNYVMRSDGTHPDAKQILFHAGPKGGGHGHFDPLSFEFFGYGRPLISDPGLVRYDDSFERNWAVSTAAHNTISANNANVGVLEDIGTGAPGIVIDEWTVADDYTQVTAHHHGYNYLSGKPVLSRSIWYDNDGTMLVLDLAEGLAAHDYATSFLVPGENKSFDPATGRFQSRNPTGGNVKIQSLLRSGQTANRQTRFVSNHPVPHEIEPAQRFYITQSGAFVAFATLITAYDGNTAPAVSASWITTNPQPGQPIQIRLVKDGNPQTITFNPPKITRLPTSNGRNNGSYTDIAYDSAGNLHMVYYDRDRKVLKYSTKDKTSGQWTLVETIDNGYLTGSNPSIAIDGKNRVGVAYTNGYAGDLKYAYFNGAQWKVQVIDAKGSTGHYPSLAFSRNDGPVIAYYNKTVGDLRMATSGGNGGWTITTLDAGAVGAKDVGRFAHLVLDPSRPDASKWAVAYEDSSAGYTMYAVQGRLSGGTYNSATGYTHFKADQSLGGYISLAFDSSHRPSLSHYDYINGDLRWAKSGGSTTRGGISFSAQTVASRGTVGAYTAHYYDASGAATILYLDKSHNKLARARLTTAWTITNLKTGGREAHVSRFGDTLAYTHVDDTSVYVLIA